MLIAPEEPGVETLRVPVLKVFDGDGFLSRIYHPPRGSSIEVTIRFGFIDAPEMDQRGGPEAQAFLQSLDGHVKELVAAYERACGHPIQVEIVDRRPGDVASSYAATAKAEALLGWRASLDVDAMCASSWLWQSQNPNGYATS
ncbi:hypothetical protein [Sphingopyxis kveilinensis]|uniref:hypothetical protein n=1 Tax=Sphingopyxis kveilinensis TaxID=3114367 RepID=UPI0030CAE6D6